MHQPPNGFDRPQKISDGNVSLPVFRSLVGTSPVIVLHELPGMTPSFIEYCQLMAHEGFKVYMPLLFKQVGATMNKFQMAKFCLSREFRHLFSVDRRNDKSRPVSNWILHLAKHVSEECPDQKIGIIGMCLTGGFALIGLADPKVAGVICCQPAFPFIFNKQSIGLTDAQRKNVVDGANQLPQPCVKGYRYDEDRICKEPHVHAIKNLLDDAFELNTMPGDGHSTVTGDSPNKEVIDEIITFLNNRLA